MEQLEHQEHDRAKSEHKRTSSVMETYLKLFIPLPIHGKKKKKKIIPFTKNIFQNRESTTKSQFPIEKIKKPVEYIHMYVCTCVPYMLNCHKLSTEHPEICF